MNKKYLARIIATDNEGLQMISAYCAGAEVKISDIKYLQKNKIFLLSLTRSKIETENENKKINSICKFEFVDSVKSKNIKQREGGLTLKLVAINFLRNSENYEISLIFANNAYITLSTEIIEVTLEDIEITLENKNKID
jgi:hypothetical protein|tara:strand:+ start:3704 stop:4120 length:417 start_codon:yes stop_codon:yes gene_type:complete